MVKAEDYPKDPRAALGRLSEELGAAWLEARGMKILERNYRNRTGEIDLIGKLKDVLVIVEIRSRSSLLWGSPAESVNYRKQYKIKQVAAYYRMQKGWTDCECRFDVLSILMSQTEGTARIDWYPNAF